MTVTEYQRPCPQIDYLEIRLEAPREMEDMLSFLLLEQGAEGIEIIDNQPIMAHLQAGDWDASVFEGQNLPIERITLRTLFPNDQRAVHIQAAIGQAVAQMSGVEMRSRIQPAVDWQEKWKEGFVARPLGRRLWIRPSWDHEAMPAERIPITVNPGQAFGTGEHPTTAMAMVLLEECLQPGMRVIDLGCGSGILAIAALQLGAAHALAVDIDDHCAAAVAEHLDLNGIDAQRFLYRTGDILSDVDLQALLRQEKAHVVLANINAAVLKELASLVKRFLLPGACIICSGILSKWGAEVMERMEENGMVVLRTMRRGDWFSFVAVPAC